MSDGGSHADVLDRGGPKLADAEGVLAAALVEYARQISQLSRRQRAASLRSVFTKCTPAALDLALRSPAIQAMISNALKG